jgi:hypothetical protein
MNYCKKKNEVNRKLFSHYGRHIFRKLKFNIYINTQKSESKMVNNFKEKYGKPENCMVIMGDFSKGKNMKGKEPVICKKFRSIFRRNKYKVNMINEFRTSKLCNKCCGTCETFFKRESHKPKDMYIDEVTGEKKGKIIIVNGLVRCKNVKCNTIYNRDKNATLNMYKIVESILEGKGRPKEYCRKSTKEIISLLLKDACRNPYVLDVYFKHPRLIINLYGGYLHIGLPKLYKIKSGTEKEKAHVSKLILKELHKNEYVWELYKKDPINTNKYYSGYNKLHSQ